MIFVQLFIHPDFQAKNFTPVKSVICNIFDSQLNNVNAYTSAGGQGGGFISPGLVSDFLQKCTVSKLELELE